MGGRRIALMLTVGLAVGTSGRAQTIVDTLHQLRTTLGQLGARGTPVPPPGAAVAASGAARAAAPSGPGAVDDALVPAAALASDQSDTRLEQTPPLPHRVAGFDVRGLRLGMSAREVARIAARQGFRRRWNDQLLTAASFEAQAAAIANRRSGRPVAQPRDLVLITAEGVDADGDFLSVRFTPEPGGSRLSGLVYRAKLGGSSVEQASAALVRKYGAPTRRGEMPGELVWRDSPSPLDTASPVLVASVGEDQLALTLTQSPDYQRAADARLQARAQQIAAAYGAGVRF